MHVVQGKNLKINYWENSFWKCHRNADLNWKIKISITSWKVVGVTLSGAFLVYYALPSVY